MEQKILCASALFVALLLNSCGELPVLPTKEDVIASTEKVGQESYTPLAPEDDASAGQETRVEDFVVVVSKPWGSIAPIEKVGQESYTPRHLKTTPASERVEDFIVVPW
jgi:hypothetical protein